MQTESSNERGQERLNVGTSQRFAWTTCRSVCRVAATLLLIAAPCACSRHSAAEDGLVQSPDHIVLKNGITVLLRPLEETDQIAIEALYRVGFLHEPKGMTQAAHLLEHLMCNCATASFEPGAAMDLLNQKGMANAETLADMTHYDYVLPASELEFALRVEAERLTSLQITREIIAQEAPRCYAEADFVERNPAAGMLKHAFMALNQAWMHGQTSALIRGGLEDIPLDAIERLHRTNYRPENLTLVLVGGFDRAKAMTLIEKYLGVIERGTPIDSPSIDWSKVPKRMTVKWDSTVRAVCVAFPPPADAYDRILLSLWGGMLMQRLMTDDEIKAVADSTFCSNHLWGVDRLPFFVYATAKKDVTSDQLAAVLVKRIQLIASETPSRMMIAQIRMLCNQLVTSSGEVDWNALRRMVTMVEAQGMDTDRATRIAIGQTALNCGITYLLFGADPAAMGKRIQATSADDLHRIIKATVQSDKQHITMLLPAGDATDAEGGTGAD
ncbi:MAG: insulinase family protein [Planctomycetes bacterium]|nr:insulinase family protein [Planctomycetota bacterium]